MPPSSPISSPCAPIKEKKWHKYFQRSSNKVLFEILSWRFFPTNKIFFNILSNKWNVSFSKIHAWCEIKYLLTICHLKLYFTHNQLCSNRTRWKRILQLKVRYYFKMQLKICAWIFKIWTQRMKYAVTSYQR